MSEGGELLMLKSMAFAVRIVNLYKWLCSEHKEYVISKQLLRSGTSIGANISEAQHAISKADFVAKIYIAAKECRESQYWIELLYNTEYIDCKQYDSIQADAVEIGKILTSVTKSCKNILPENNASDNSASE